MTDSGSRRSPRHQHGSARAALWRAVRSVAGQGDRPHHRRSIAPSSRPRRSSRWHRAGPTGSTARRAATRRASCGSPTRRRCSSPTGAATTASTRCATSCTTRASRCCFSIPGVRRDDPRQRPRHDLDRSGADAKASSSTARRRARCIVVAVERVYYQCAKAIVRSKLWDASRHVERKSLPSAGTILADITQRQDGRPGARPPAPERLKATIY